MYFYNSDNYETVVAHASDNEGNSITGEWGTATASELGEGWMEVTVSASPGFRLTFADKDDDTKNVTVDITDTVNIYVSLNGKYTSKEAAEASVSGNNSNITRVWFYNVYGYENVKVHGKRAKEKGIVILARLLFGRTMVTILLLLLQIITLVVAFKWFQNYTDWFYHIMVVLSAAFVIYIVKSFCW